MPPPASSAPAATPAPAPAAAPSPSLDFPNLPSVPNDLLDPDTPKQDDDEIDFDELSRRFENLKKKK